MLTEIIEYGRKIEERVKTMQSEIKETTQETNSKGKETRTQINGLDQKEDITFNQNRMKKQEFKKKKNEERPRNLQDIFKCSYIWIIGVPEGE